MAAGLARLGGLVARLVAFGQRTPGAGLMALAALDLLWVLPSAWIPSRPASVIGDDQGWREVFVCAWLSADLVVVALVLAVAGWRAGTSPGAGGTASAPAGLPRARSSSGSSVVVPGASWLLGLATAVVIFGVCCEIYDVAIVAVFRRPADLYDDVLLLPDLANLALDLDGGGPLWIVAALSVLVVMALGVAAALSVIAGAARAVRVRPRTGVAIAAGVVAMLGAIHLERGLTARDAAAQSTALRLVANVRASAATWGEGADAPERPPAVIQSYGDLRLSEPPNILLFVVESYGDVLWRDPALEALFAPRAAALSETLRRGGWHVATSLSSAPVSGGLSWLSSATLLGGTTVDSQHAYRRAIAHAGDALPAALERAGYRTVSVAAANRERPGRPLANPYGFDVTLFYDELAYPGRPYGWGVIPDGYSLAVAHRRAVAGSDRPVFLYFTSVSSHAPWNDLPPREASTAPPPPIERSLGERIAAKLRRRFADPNAGLEPAAYVAAVDYVLTVIADYLVTDAPPHTLAVVIGDHPPPLLHKGDGTATPVHLLARDPALLARAPGYALGDLRPPSHAALARHEDLAATLRQVLEAFAMPGEGSL